MHHCYARLLRWFAQTFRRTPLPSPNQLRFKVQDGPAAPPDDLLMSDCPTRAEPDSSHDDAR